MAKHTVSFTADGTSEICRVKRRQGANAYQATVFAYGSTFGSGSVAIKASPDGGTTKISLRNAGGTVVALTANDVVSIPEIGNGNALDDEIILYAALSGSTNPSITVEIWDNT